MANDKQAKRVKKSYTFTKRQVLSRLRFYKKAWGKVATDVGRGKALAYDLAIHLVELMPND